MIPLRQQGVGWDTVTTTEMEIKWEAIILFGVRWKEWLYLSLPHCFEAIIDLVRKGTRAAWAGMWATSVVAWGCTSWRVAAAKERWPWKSGTCWLMGISKNRGTGMWREDLHFSPTQTHLKLMFLPRAWVFLKAQVYQDLEITVSPCWTRALKPKFWGEK